MNKAREKIVVNEIEFITFDEFIEYGKNQPDANIVDGIPWSFNYKGVNITNENEECYIIVTRIGHYYFTPNDYLITDELGDIYPVSKGYFDSLYEII